MQPIRPPGAAREPRRRRRSPGPGRGWAVLVVVVGIVAALYFLGNSGGATATATTRRCTTPTDDDLDDEEAPDVDDAGRRRPRPARAPRAGAGRPRPASSACGSSRPDRSTSACSRAGGGTRRQRPRSCRPARASRPTARSASGCCSATARRACGSTARRARSPPTGGILGYEITPPGRVRPLSAGEPPELRRMSARAGIVVTGTEVLTGRVADRNGPWLSDRLRDLGVDHALTRRRRRPARGHGAARCAFLASIGVDLIVTSGGLGPTADDLTAEVVGRFQGRAMVLDDALEERIGEILDRYRARWPGLDPEAVRASNRKQAIVPAGATILDPVGTAPGLVVPPASGNGGPTVVVLPGPPRELQDMWPAAAAADTFAAAIAGATQFRQRTLRLYGIPESEIAETLRAAEARRPGLDGLEITTCLRRGELEVVTRFEPAAEPRLRRLRGGRPRAPRRHAVLDGRLDDRPAGRGPAARPRLHDRDGRVVHRRPARGPPDRPGGLVGLRRSAASSCTRTRRRRRWPACPRT